MEGDLNDGISRSEWQPPATRTPDQPNHTPEQQPRQPEFDQARTPEQPTQPQQEQPGQAEQARPEPVQPARAKKEFDYRPPSEQPVGPPRTGADFLQRLADETPPDFVDRNFRITDAEHARLAARWADYPPKQMALHRERGRAQLGDLVDELTDVDIIAMEHLLKMDHDWINRGLRANDVAVQTDPVVRAAAAALHKLPDVQGGAHRGLSPSTPEKLADLLERYEVGKTANEKAFTHSDKLEEAAHSGTVQLHISSKHGKDLSFLRDPHLGIQEIVHPPSTDFFPMHRQFDEASGTWHIYVRDHSGPYVPEGGAPDVG